MLRRYIAGSVTRAFVLVALALTGLFSLLEFVEQLASVGEGRYHVAGALLFVLLTAPSRLLQVTPVSMLLGCLFAFGALARNSELTAMLSLGIAERRVMGSALRPALAAIAVLLLLMEFVIPPAQELAREQRASALSDRDADSSFWAQRDRQYLNVQRFERGDVPIGIDIYSFLPDGSLDSIVHAARADIRQDGTWRLSDVSRRRVHDGEISTDHPGQLAWRSFISPRQIQFLILPLDSIPPLALYRHIHGLQGDQRGTRYEQQLWTQASLPLSVLAMMLAAAPFVFGSPRSQSSGQHLAHGVGVGVVYSLGQQIVGRLGLLLGVSPAVAAMAPPLLVMAGALYLFRRAHRPRRRLIGSSAGP